PAAVADGEVHLRLGEVPPADHRFDVAVVVDGDERTGRIVLRVVERVVHRVPRLRLHAPVEGRLHHQTGTEDALPAVVALQLPTHVVDEVAGAPLLDDLGLELVLVDDVAGGPGHRRVVDVGDVGGGDHVRPPHRL